jgi:hypothetical protein
LEYRKTKQTKYHGCPRRRKHQEPQWGLYHGEIALFAEISSLIWFQNRAESDPTDPILQLVRSFANEKLALTRG